MTEFQKVARLLAHLDPSARERVLARLPEPHRRELLSCLNEVSSFGTDDLTELVREYQSHLIGLSSPPAIAEEPITDQRHAPDQIDWPFAMDELFELLADESDRTVSALLAHLPEAEGKELYQLFDPARRDRVASLLETQRELSLPVIEEVGRYLRDKQARRARVPRGNSVLNRLFASDEPVPEVVEGQIEEADRSFLQRLRRLYGESAVR